MKTLSLSQMEQVQGGWPSTEDWVCYRIGLAYSLACFVCGAVAGAACMLAQDHINRSFRIRRVIIPMTLLYSTN